MSVDACVCVCVCACACVCVCMYILVLVHGGLLELLLEAESPTQSGQTLSHSHPRGACICGRTKRVTAWPHCVELNPHSIQRLSFHNHG